MPWEKQFNVDDALCAARDAFWEQGYEATSMQQLLDRMGINRGSFYDTFNSKHDVLLKSLSSYCHQRTAQLTELAESTTGLDCIKAMFDCALTESRSTTAQNGCFTVNCALELAPRDDDVAQLVQQSIMATQQYLQAQITRAVAEGDARPDTDAQATSKTIMAMLLGIRVLARAGAPKACLQSIPDQALALLT